MNEVQKFETASTSPSPTEYSLREIAAGIWRRKWIVLLVMGSCLSLAAYVAHKTPKAWQASAQMLLIKRPIVTGATADYTPPLADIDTELGLMQSPAMAQRTLDWLKNDSFAKGQSLDLSDIDLDNFQKSVIVANPKDSAILNISAVAKSPQKAQLLADAVCQAFVEWDRELAQQDIQKTVEALSLRADTAKQHLEAAEREERIFRQKNDLYDALSQQKTLENELAARETSVSDLQNTVASEANRVDSLGKQLAEGNKAIKQDGGIRDDSLVLSLQTQLTTAEADLAQAKQTYTARYPDMLQPREAHVRDLKHRLAKELAKALNNKAPSLTSQSVLLDNYKQAQVQLSFMKAALASAVSVRDAVQRRRAAMPHITEQFDNIDRKVTLANTLYTSLQASLNAARLNKDKINGNMQITQAATVPDLPFRPNIFLSMIIGTLLGAFLSMACVFVLEGADRRIRTLDQVRRLVPGPIVGIMPMLSRSASASLDEGELLPQTVMAYSHVRANLGLVERRALSGAVETRVILVTSAISGEGKSVTAAHLARSQARAGKSVLLIDANLRHPSLTTLFPGEYTYGLTDVLMGRANVEEAIVATGVYNLSVLHSGAPTPQATELISSPKMEEILTKLRREVDIVIIDAPACAEHADALFLAAHTDFILHVLGLGMVDVQTEEDTLAQLATSSKSIAYFVNRAPRDRKRFDRLYTPDAFEENNELLNGIGQNGSAPNQLYTKREFSLLKSPKRGSDE